MTNCDMIIATVDAYGNIIVDDYWSCSLTAPVCDVDLGGTNNVIARMLCSAEGYTVVEFVQLFVTNDTKAKAIPMNRPTKVSWAFRRVADL